MEFLLIYLAHVQRGSKNMCKELQQLRQQGLCYSGLHGDWW